MTICPVGAIIFMYHLLFYFTIFMLCYFAHMHIFWFDLNGGFHPSETLMEVSMANISLICSCYIMLLLCILHDNDCYIIAG